jgi:hypothetical protein
MAEQMGADKRRGAEHDRCRKGGGGMPRDAVHQRITADEVQVDVRDDQQVL